MNNWLMDLNAACMRQNQVPVMSAPLTARGGGCVVGAPLVGQLLATAVRGPAAAGLLLLLPLFYFF